MKRTIDRTLQILLWGVAVTLVWGLVGLTPWGAARSVVDAGPGYDHALQPVGYFVGALLVAVPGILLVNRSSAAWRRRHATVEPAACPEKPGIAKGRTIADLAAEPPLADAVGLEIRRRR